MAKRLTLVLRVSDDTSEMFQEWIDNATGEVLFMGTVTELIKMNLEPDDPWLRVDDVCLTEPSPIDVCIPARQYLDGCNERQLIQGTVERDDTGDE